jgi:hypothetical protein
MGKGAMRKAEKMMAREQAKRSEKLNKLASMQRVNPLTACWQFDRWYEKVILFVLMNLGIWKLFELVVL